MISIETTGKCAMCPYCEIKYEREITSFGVFAEVHCVHSDFCDHLEEFLTERKGKEIDSKFKECIFG